MPSLTSPISRLRRRRHRRRTARHRLLGRLGRVRRPRRPRQSVHPRRRLRRPALRQRGAVDPSRPGPVRRGRARRDAGPGGPGGVRSRPRRAVPPHSAPVECGGHFGTRPLGPPGGLRAAPGPGLLLPVPGRGEMWPVDVPGPRPTPTLAAGAAIRVRLLQRLAGRVLHGVRPHGGGRPGPRRPPGRLPLRVRGEDEPAGR